jgi:hypothetical protein
MSTSFVIDMSILSFFVSNKDNSSDASFRVTQTPFTGGVAGTPVTKTIYSTQTFNENGTPPGWSGSANQSKGTSYGCNFTSTVDISNNRVNTSISFSSPAPLPTPQTIRGTCRLAQNLQNPTDPFELIKLETVSSDFQLITLINNSDIGEFIFNGTGLKFTCFKKPNNFRISYRNTAELSGLASALAGSTFDCKVPINDQDIMAAHLCCILSQFSRVFS